MTEKPTYEQLKKRVRELEQALQGAMDDTTLRQLRKNLQRKNEELQRAQRVANIGSWHFNPDTQRPTWSTEMFRIFGLPLSENAPSYETHRKIIHPEDWERFDAAVRRAVEKGIGYDLELRVIRPDGQVRHVNSRCEAIRDPDGNVIELVGTTQDIHEKKRIMEAMQQREEKLRRETEYRLKQSIQADRLAALGEVVAGVAHEINNPNSFITYNVPMLKEIWDVMEPVVRDHATEHPAFKGKPIQPDEMIEDMNDVIESIRIGSERISKVVVNLKEFARLDEGPEFKSIDINEIIEKTLTIVGAQLRRSADRVVTRLEENLPEIQGHFGRIEQVLANLLTNASHALSRKRGSVISVSTRYIKRLRAVIVTVEDNGIGMAAATLYRIFEPFYTTRRSTGGTGLGLSISHGIVKDHKGLLGVHSKPDVGTCFTLFLPENQDVKLELQPTILCVDDENALPELIKSYFARAKPAPAEIITNPEKVLAHLEEHPEIDVVISDIRMPKINGWELLQRIKARFPLMSVILYSGHPEELESDGRRTVQPDGIIEKPFDLKILERKIEEIGRCFL